MNNMTEKKVRQLLYDNGFFNKYYYILKVFNSCKTMEYHRRISAENKVSIWGREVLHNLVEQIVSKHKADATFIRLIADEYILNI